MVRRSIEVGAAWPLLDIASYARRGPDDRVHLAQEEIQLLSRTVRRTPEVMVKVLTMGGRNLKAVGRHLTYLSHDGEVEIETDDGQRLSGQGREQELVEDWDLDLEEARRTTDLRSRPGAVRPKLVHKAVSEEGVRLNIRKATLREWRREFARHLRAHGISANATDKAVRGTTRANLSDGMYRAMQRGAPRRIPMHMRSQGMQRKPASEAFSRESLLHTRAQVERGWLATAEILDRQGQGDLAWYVRRFTEALPPVRTDRELLSQSLRPADRVPPQQGFTR